jgi:tripartite-type tricarboxylate transporter receptor subunit TctC
MRRRALLASPAAIALAAPAAAQAWPSRPVRWIVPYAAGGTGDIVARAVAPGVAALIGREVVVENRTGANGMIGTELVARAAPDGHTMLLGVFGPLTVMPHLVRMPYDPQRDLAPVALMVSVPNLVVVPVASPLRSMQELLDAARAKPGTMNFASAGQGSATHLNAEKFKIGAGIDALHVPFKGSPEAVTEVMTGRVDYYFAPLAPVISLIKEGKLLAVAVGSPRRSSALPDVPTTLEAGVPNSDYNFWIGMMVPSKTPRPMLDRLYTETSKALASPEMKKRYADLGAEPMNMKPEQFDAYIRKEIAENMKLVKTAGIKTQ